MTAHSIPATPTTNGAEGRGGGELEMIALEKELQARGVNASLLSLLVNASLSAIRRSIDWWDAQSEAGPGVLVATIRKGGVTEQQSLLDQQREYGEQVRDWLTQSFPGLTDGRWGPHPAAVAAVIRLHYQHGKGRLTGRKHGPEIRAAVRAWQEKWESESATEKRSA